MPGSPSCLHGHRRAASSRRGVKASRPLTAEVLQEPLVAPGLAVAAVDDEPALQRCRGLRAAGHALMPLATLLLLCGPARPSAFPHLSPPPPRRLRAPLAPALNCAGSRASTSASSTPSASPFSRNSSVVCSSRPMVLSALLPIGPSPRVCRWVLKFKAVVSCTASSTGRPRARSITAWRCAPPSSPAASASACRAPVRSPPGGARPAPPPVRWRRCRKTGRRPWPRPIRRWPSGWKRPAGRANRRRSFSSGDPCAGLRGRGF